MTPFGSKYSSAEYWNPTLPRSEYSPDKETGSTDIRTNSPCRFGHIWINYYIFATRLII